MDIPDSCHRKRTQAFWEATELSISSWAKEKLCTHLQQMSENTLTVAATLRCKVLLNLDMLNGTGDDK